MPTATSFFHTDSPEAVEVLCDACAEARGERDRCGPSGAPCEACGARAETPTAGGGVGAAPVTRLRGSLAQVLAALEARGVVRLEFVGGPVPGAAVWAAVPPPWDDTQTLWELVVQTAEGDVHAGTVVTGRAG